MTDRLHDLLSGSAERQGEALAVVDGARTVTYSELDRRANQLAHQLIELGVSPGDRVGIHLEKSIEAVLAIYGALKAGAVYVPLDAAAPSARLGYIAQDCDIRCLLTGEEEASRLDRLLMAGAPIEAIVVLNGRPATRVRPPGVRVFGPEALDAQPDVTPACPAGPHDLAYLLYTSGSTGAPKGVMLSHRNALSFVEWAAAYVGVHASDRLSSHAPFHFDLSIFDLFAAARAGAALVLVPPDVSRFPIELVRFVERTQITVWYSVPSVLSMVALRGGLTGSRLPRLRAVLFAGEVFPTRHLRRLMRLLPQARFLNLYGPTETNVCTYYEVPQLPDDRLDQIPIGRAIAGVEVFAVRQDDTPVPSGEVGELYVRGPTVMRGYWRNPERTAAVLVPDPTAPDAGGLVYRTGDLVCEDDDGNFLFLGRKDNQIKSRGYRIELGEIETTLLAHPAVVECAVTAIPDDVVTNRIRAFVVADQEIDAVALVRFLGERLPKYMIPESFDFLDTLPKTSTGKTDRQRLTAKAGASA